MELDGQHLDTLISDPQRRSEVIAAIEEYARVHPGDENLPALNELRVRLASDDVFIPAADTQLELLQNVLGALSSHRTASIFGPPAGAQPTFLERQEDDNLGTFIDRNLEYLGLSRDIPREERARLAADLTEFTAIEDADADGHRRSTGIHLNSVKQWGRRGENGEFVEPRLMEQALKVYEWLEAQAAKHGARIDIWDFLATIYPPVREMLAGAGQANGEIVVRVPKFMENLNFGQFSYGTFARAAKTSRLITDIPDGTVGHHVREEVERPKWETLNRYAEIISSQADGDDVHRRQIFDFLVFLRLLPILKTTATARDMADRPLTEPVGAHVSRHTVRVVPESELVEYMSFGETARFSIQRWPFSDIASGHFDRMLEMLGRRIEAFEIFSADIGTTELAALRSRIAELRAQHAIHKAMIANPSADRSRLTLEYLNEIRSFYRQLDRFFKQTVFFTHGRGSVQFGGLTVPFEIVPQVGGVQVSPVVDGRITVFADDIIARGEDVRTLFDLRLLATWHVASGMMAAAELENAQAIFELAKRFGFEMSDEELMRNARTLAEMNAAARQDTHGVIDPALHRAIQLRTTGRTEQRTYYLYDFDHPWRNRLTEFYREQGYSQDAVYFDTEIVEAYFTSVRHPHFIFNAAKLDAAIGNVYGNASDASAARERIDGFLRYVNVLTESHTRHPLSPDDTSPENKAIEWAFKDYLENFPGAHELGARIEMNEVLLSEVVDREIAEHPDVHLRRGLIRRGVIAAINRFNEGHAQSVEEIGRDFLPLPDEGIFPQRFYAFLDKWGHENYATLALDKQKLLLVYSLLGDRPLIFDNIDPALAQIGVQEAFLDENANALFAWGIELYHELELFEKMANPGAVKEYLTENYNAPLVSATTASQLILQYLKLRLTTPQPVNLNALIVRAIGDRFDPYPSIKAEVVAFYHMFIREYLNSVLERSTERHRAAVSAADEVARQIESDPWYAVHGISDNDFDRKLVSALDLLPPDVKNPDPLRPVQYHPTLKDVMNIDHQTRLLAEALGKPAPIDLERHIYQAYDRVSQVVAQKIEAQQRRLTEQKQQLVLSEIPIRDFWRRVERSLAEYSTDYADSANGRDEIDTALRNIARGLEIIAGLKTELDGTIMSEWTRAAKLAAILSDDDDTGEMIENAESLMATTKGHLEEQQLLLQIRLEEIGELEARQAADQRAQAIIGRASAVTRDAQANKKGLLDLTARIRQLSDEMKGFAQLLSQQTTPSFEDHQSQWTRFEGYEERLSALRSELNGIRDVIESISPSGIYKEMVAARDTLDMSDAIKTQMTTARTDLVRAVSDLRGTLEQAEIVMTRVGGTLSTIRRRLTQDEAALPAPSSFTVPDTGEHLTQSAYIEDRSFISFNTSGHAAASRGRMSKLMDAMRSIRILAIGDRAYLVYGTASATAQTWIGSERGSPLSIIDIFGRPIVVDAGMRSIRFVDGREMDITLVRKMELVLSGRGHEADLATRIFEASLRDERGRELWQRFLSEMANEDLRSQQDALLFTRRFAIAYKEDIDSSKTLSKNNWFVEETSPIQVELSSEEVGDILKRTSEQISLHVNAIHGAQNMGIVSEMTHELSTAMKEQLSTTALEWWNARESEGIPKELAILWGVLHRGHNSAILKKMLVLLLSSQIETDLHNNMGVLPADLTPLLRAALRFVMENIIEIRFGDVLYLNGKLLYDLKKHKFNAELTKVRLDHPELRTVLFSSRYDPRKRIGMLVNADDYERILHHSRAVGRGNISFEHFNVDAGRMEKRSFEMTGVAAGPSPLDGYAHIIYEIFREPRLLALGYMVSSISSLLATDNGVYEAMIGLFEKHRFPVEEPESSRIKKLIDLERDIELLYRRCIMGQETGPAAPASPSDHEGPGIIIDGFLDDSTAVTVDMDAPVITGVDEASMTLLFAHKAIESSLERNLGGFKDLPPQTRKNMVQAVANMARLRPGEPITVTQQALQTYYMSMGLGSPVAMQAFTIPNLFMMNLPLKIR